MKPKTLQDLLVGGHITNREVEFIARSIFDGQTRSSVDNDDILDGYVVKACDFDTLPDHVKGFVLKAIRAFRVENILDYATNEEENLPLTDDDGPA